MEVGKVFFSAELNRDPFDRAMRKLQQDWAKVTTLKATQVIEQTIKPKTIPDPVKSVKPQQRQTATVATARPAQQQPMTGIGNATDDVRKFGDSVQRFSDAVDKLSKGKDVKIKVNEQKSNIVGVALGTAITTALTHAITIGLDRYREKQFNKQEQAAGRQAVQSFGGTQGQATTLIVAVLREIADNTKSLEDIKRNTQGKGILGNLLSAPGNFLKNVGTGFAFNIGAIRGEEMYRPVIAGFRAATGFDEEKRNRQLMQGGAIAGILYKNSMESLQKQIDDTFSSYQKFIEYVNKNQAIPVPKGIQELNKFIPEEIPLTFNLEKAWQQVKGLLQKIPESVPIDITFLGQGLTEFLEKSNIAKEGKVEIPLRFDVDAALLSVYKSLPKNIEIPLDFLSENIKAKLRELQIITEKNQLVIPARLGIYQLKKDLVNVYKFVKSIPGSEIKLFDGGKIDLTGIPKGWEQAKELMAAGYADFRKWVYELTKDGVIINYIPFKISKFGIDPETNNILLKAVSDGIDSLNSFLSEKYGGNTVKLSIPTPIIELPNLTKEIPFSRGEGDYIGKMFEKAYDSVYTQIGAAFDTATSSEAYNKLIEKFNDFVVNLPPLELKLPKLLQVNFDKNTLPLFRRSLLKVFGKNFFKENVKLAVESFGKIDIDIKFPLVDIKLTGQDEAITGITAKLTAQIPTVEEIGKSVSNAINNLLSKDIPIEIKSPVIKLPATLFNIDTTAFKNIELPIEESIKAAYGGESDNIQRLYSNILTNLFSELNLSKEQQKQFASKVPQLGYINKKDMATGITKSTFIPQNNTLKLKPSDIRQLASGVLNPRLFEDINNALLDAIKASFPDVEVTTGILNIDDGNADEVTQKLRELEKEQGATSVKKSFSLDAYKEKLKQTPELFTPDNAIKTQVDNALSRIGEVVKQATENAKIDFIIPVSRLSWLLDDAQIKAKVNDLKVSIEKIVKEGISIKLEIPPITLPTLQIDPNIIVEDFVKNINLLKVYDQVNNQITELQSKLLKSEQSTRIGKPQKAPQYIPPKVSAKTQELFPDRSSTEAIGKRMSELYGAGGDTGEIDKHYDLAIKSFIDDTIGRKEHALKYAEPLYKDVIQEYLDVFDIPDNLQQEILAKIPKLNILSDQAIADGIEGGYTPANNTLSLPKKVIEDLSNGIIDKDTFDTIFHEFTHALQSDFGEISDIIHKSVLDVLGEGANSKLKEGVSPELMERIKKASKESVFLYEKDAKRGDRSSPSDLKKAIQAETEAYLVGIYAQQQVFEKYQKVLSGEAAPRVKNISQVNPNIRLDIVAKLGIPKQVELEEVETLPRLFNDAIAIVQSKIDEIREKTKVEFTIPLTFSGFSQEGGSQSIDEKIGNLYETIRTQLNQLSEKTIGESIVIPLTNLTLTYAKNKVITPLREKIQKDVKALLNAPALVAEGARLQVEPIKKELDDAQLIYDYIQDIKKQVEEINAIPSNIAKIQQQLETPDLPFEKILELKQELSDLESRAAELKLNPDIEANLRNELKKITVGDEGQDLEAINKTKLSKLKAQFESLEKQIKEQGKGIEVSLGEAIEITGLNLKLASKSVLEKAILSIEKAIQIGIAKTTIKVPSPVDVQIEINPIIELENVAKTLIDELEEKTGLARDEVRQAVLGQLSSEGINIDTLSEDDITKRIEDYYRKFDELSNSFDIGLDPVEIPAPDISLDDDWDALLANSSIDEQINSFEDDWEAKLAALDEVPTAPKQTKQGFNPLNIRLPEINLPDYQRLKSKFVEDLYTTIQQSLSKSRGLKLRLPSIDLGDPKTQPLILGGVKAFTKGFIESIQTEIDRSTIDVKFPSINLPDFDAVIAQITGLKKAFEQLKSPLNAQLVDPINKQLEKLGKKPIGIDDIKAARRQANNTYQVLFTHSESKTGKPLSTFVSGKNVKDFGDIIAGSQLGKIFEPIKVGVDAVLKSIPNEIPIEITWTIPKIPLPQDISIPVNLAIPENIKFPDFFNADKFVEVADTFKLAIDSIIVELKKLDLQAVAVTGSVQGIFEDIPSRPIKPTVHPQQERIQANYKDFVNTYLSALNVNSRQRIITQQNLPKLKPLTDEQIKAGLSGGYNRKTNEILLPAKAFQELGRGKLSPETFNTLAHEITHALQTYFGTLSDSSRKAVLDMVSKATKAGIKNGIDPEKAKALLDASGGSSAEYEAYLIGDHFEKVVYERYQSALDGIDAQIEKSAKQVSNIPVAPQIVGTGIDKIADALKTKVEKANNVLNAVGQTIPSQSNISEYQQQPLQIEANKPQLGTKDALQRQVINPDDFIQSGKNVVYDKGKSRIEDALALLESQWKLTVNAVISRYNSLANQVSSVSKIIQKSGQSTASNVTTKLTTIKGSIGDAIWALDDQLVLIGNTILDRVKGIGQGVTRAVNTVKNVNYSGIASSITTKLTTIKDGIGDAIWTLDDQLVLVGSNILDKVKGVGHGVTRAVNTVKNINYSGIASNITTKLTTIKDGIGDAIWTLDDQLVSMGNVVSNGVTNVGQGIQKVRSNGLRKTLLSVLDSAYVQLFKLEQNIINVERSVRSSIRHNKSSFTNAISQTVENVSNAVQAKYSQIKTSVKSTVDKVKSSIPSISLTGFIQGIVDGINSINKKVVSSVDGVKSGVNNVNKKIPLPHQIKDVATEPNGRVTRQPTGIIGSVIQGIQSGVGRIVGMVSPNAVPQQKPSNIKTNADYAKEGVKQTLKDAGNSAVNAGADAVDAVQEVMEDIGIALEKGLVNAAKKIGKGEKVQDSLDRARESIKGKSESIVDSINNALSKIKFPDLKGLKIEIPKNLEKDALAQVTHLSKIFAKLESEGTKSIGDMMTNGMTEKQASAYLHNLTLLGDQINKLVADLSFTSIKGKFVDDQDVQQFTKLNRYIDEYERRIKEFKKYSQSKEFAALPEGTKKTLIALNMQAERTYENLKASAQKAYVAISTLSEDAISKLPKGVQDKIRGLIVKGQIASGDYTPPKQELTFWESVIKRVQDGYEQVKRTLPAIAAIEEKITNQIKSRQQTKIKSFDTGLNAYSQGLVALQQSIKDVSKTGDIKGIESQLQGLIKQSKTLQQVSQQSGRGNVGKHFIESGQIKDFEKLIKQINEYEKVLKKLNSAEVKSQVKGLSRNEQQQFNKTKRQAQSEYEALQKEIAYILNELGKLDKAYLDGLSRRERRIAQRLSKQGVDPNQLTGFKAFVEGIKSNIEKLTQRFPVLERVPELLQNVGLAALGLIGVMTFGDAIVNFARSLFEVGLQAEQLKISLDFAIATDANQKLIELKATADRLGVSFLTLADGYQKFAATTIGTSLESQTDRIYTQIQSGFAVRGLPKQRQEQAQVAISQIASKGVVQSEELRGQLSEAVPGAIQTAARAYGKSVQEFLKQVETGTVLAEEFLPKFAKQIEKESRSSLDNLDKSTTAAINRFKSQWESLQTLGNNPILDVAKLGINAATAGLKALAAVAGLVSSVLSGLFIALLIKGAIVARDFAYKINFAEIATKGLGTVVKQTAVAMASFVKSVFFFAALSKTVEGVYRLFVTGTEDSRTSVEKLKSSYEQLRQTLSTPLPSPFQPESSDTPIKNDNFNPFNTEDQDAKNAVQQYNESLKYAQSSIDLITPKFSYKEIEKATRIVTDFDNKLASLKTDEAIAISKEDIKRANELNKKIADITKQKEIYLELKFGGVEDFVSQKDVLENNIKEYKKILADSYSGKVQLSAGEVFYSPQEQLEVENKKRSEIKDKIKESQQKIKDIEAIQEKYNITISGTNAEYRKTLSLLNDIDKRISNIDFAYQEGLLKTSNEVKQDFLKGNIWQVDIDLNVKKEQLNLLKTAQADIQKEVNEAGKILSGKLTESVDKQLSAIFEGQLKGQSFSSGLKSGTISPEAIDNVLQNYEKETTKPLSDVLQSALESAKKQLTLQRQNNQKQGEILDTQIDINNTTFERAKLARQAALEEKLSKRNVELLAKYPGGGRAYNVEQAQAELERQELQLQELYKQREANIGNPDEVRLQIAQTNTAIANATANLIKSEYELEVAYRELAVKRRLTSADIATLKEDPFGGVVASYKSAKNEVNRQNERLAEAYKKLAKNVGDPIDIESEIEDIKLAKAQADANFIAQTKNYQDAFRTLALDKELGSARRSLLAQFPSQGGLFSLKEAELRVADAVKRWQVALDNLAKYPDNPEFDRAVLDTENALAEAQANLISQQRNWQRSLYDFQRSLEDFYISSVREVRGLQESYDDLMRGLNRSLQEAQNALNTSQRQLRVQQLRVNLNQGITFDNSIAKQFSDFIVDFQDQLNAIADEADGLKLRDFDIQEQLIQGQRNIRNIQEQIFDAERSRLNQIEQLRRQEEDLFGSRKALLEELNKTFEIENEARQKQVESINELTGAFDDLIKNGFTANNVQIPTYTETNGYRDPNFTPTRVMQAEFSEIPQPKPITYKKAPIIQQGQYLGTSEYDPMDNRQKRYLWEQQNPGRTWNGETPTGMPNPIPQQPTIPNQSVNLQPQQVAITPQNITLNLSGKEQLIANWAKNLGFTPSAIAATLGNFLQEGTDNGVKFNPYAYNESSGAYGIAQWLGSRKTALLNQYPKTGNESTDLQNQLKFAQSELTQTQLNILRSANTIDEAMRAWNSFERWSEWQKGRGGAEAGNRYNYAEDYYRRMSPQSSINSNLYAQVGMSDMGNYEQITPVQDVVDKLPEIPKPDFNEAERLLNERNLLDIQRQQTDEQANQLKLINAQQQGRRQLINLSRNAYFQALQTAQSVRSQQISTEDLLMNSKGYLTVQEQIYKVGRDILKTYDDQIISLKDQKRAIQEQVDAWTPERVAEYRDALIQAGLSAEQVNQAIAQANEAIAILQRQLPALDQAINLTERDKQQAVTTGQNRERERIDLDSFKTYSETKAGFLSQIAEGSDPITASLLNVEAATLRVNAAFAQQRYELQQLKDAGQITAVQFDELTGALNKAEQVQLDKAFLENNVFAREFATQLKGVFTGATSVEDALRNLALSVLDLAATWAANQIVLSLFGGVFGGIGGGGIGGGIARGVTGAFKDGGTVGVKNFTDGGKIEPIDVANFAGGGSVLGLGLGVMEAMKREGPGATPIVAQEGEEIVSNKGGESAFLRYLKRSGRWSQMRKEYQENGYERTPINNYRGGGTVGNVANLSINRGGNSGQPTIVNNSYQTHIEVKAQDANSFRASRAQILQQERINQDRANRNR